jgi:formate dehydrogenase major subunit
MALATSGVEACLKKCARPCTAIEGVTWSRLQREGSVTYPCLSADDPGQPIVFTDHFPTADGRVSWCRPRSSAPTSARCRLPHGADHRPPAGTLAHRQHDPPRGVLDAWSPSPTASLHGATWPAGPAAGRPGARGLPARRVVQLTARRDDGTPPGTVFIPFAYVEAAANLLTNAALDPFGKIPELQVLRGAGDRGVGRVSKRKTGRSPSA